MRLILSIILSTTLFTCLKIEANESKYDRHEWLPSWSDTDRDCQNTRHELLIQFSLAPVSFTNDKSYTVKSGLSLGPYTGKFFDLASGAETAI